jgi:hypothetical protein
MFMQVAENLKRELDSRFSMSNYFNFSIATLLIVSSSKSLTGPTVTRWSTYVFFLPSCQLTSIYLVSNMTSVPWKLAECDLLCVSLLTMNLLVARFAQLADSGVDDKKQKFQFTWSPLFDPTEQESKKKPEGLEWKYHCVAISSSILLLIKTLNRHLAVLYYPSVWPGTV